MALTAIRTGGAYVWVRGTEAEIDYVRGTPSVWPLTKTSAFVPRAVVGTEVPPDPPDPPPDEPEPDPET